MFQAKVAHMDISLGENESVISHGKSKWLNHDKMAKFLREGWNLGVFLLIAQVLDDAWMMPHHLTES